MQKYSENDDVSYVNEVDRHTADYSLLLQAAGVVTPGRSAAAVGGGQTRSTTRGPSSETGASAPGATPVKWDVEPPAPKFEILEAASQHGATGGSAGPSINLARRHSVATANVRSLRPREQASAGVQVAGAQLVSKIVILEEEFDAAELDVIGIQEGRAAATDIRTGMHYERYVGAADGDGSYDARYG